MIKIEMETNKNGKFVVELKTVLDIIEYYQTKIDNATEYINKTQMGAGYKKMLLEILDKGE